MGLTHVNELWYNYIVTKLILVVKIYMFSKIVVIIQLTFMLKVEHVKMMYKKILKGLLQVKKIVKKDIFC